MEGKRYLSSRFEVVEARGNDVHPSFPFYLKLKYSQLFKGWNFRVYKMESFVSQIRSF